MISKAAVRWLRFYMQTISPIASIARNFIRRSGSISIKAINCLDIGAGTAPYEGVIRRSFGTTNYIAMDIAPSDHCNLIADARALPFIDEALDLVVSFDVIQHVVAPVRMLDEIFRVLKPGGHVILTFPFMYAECDFHDYQRWTMEGMIEELKHREFDIILAQRRGGVFFAGSSFLTWAMQHAISGQRRSWRADRTASQVLRTIVVLLLTIPTTALQWITLLMDRILSVQGCYMGGTILARRRRT